MGKKKNYLIIGYYIYVYIIFCCNNVVLKNYKWKNWVNRCVLNDWLKVLYLIIIKY